jgi:hypothetical protein
MIVLALRSRFCLVGLVLLVLAAMPPLAFASPPDPSWIQGLYDDADYDDVVGLVTSGTGCVALTPLPDPRPIPSVVRRAPTAPREVPRSRPISGVRLRAPPAF